MTAKDKTKQKKLSALKQILVENLDEFLLETEDSQNKINRQIALAELDKLIKQDINSDSAILNIQQNKAKQQAMVEEVVKKIKHVRSRITTAFADEIPLSGNILDLRQIKKPAPVNKSKEYKKVWQNLKEDLTDKFSHPKFSSPKKENLNYHRPKVENKPFTWHWPQINWSAFRLRRGGLTWKLVTFALIVLVLLMPIRGLVLLGKIQTDKDKIWQLGKSGLVNLQSGALSAADSSYQDAEADFEQALANFRAIQAVLDEYQSWLLETGELLPIIGRPLSLGQNLVPVANNISQAAVILNKKLQNQESLTNHIVFIRQQISETLPYLQAAAKDVDKINTSQLPVEIQTYFVDLQNYLPSMVESLKNLDEIFDVLLEILGHDQEKRYLILFQNNNELRATGGFIGSIALVDVYQGKIKNLEIPKGGTYDLAAGQTIQIKSPKALSLINPYFNIWDANWWPDFPQSAKKIMWFFETFNGSAVDGVIGINADVLQDLLGVVGPIYLGEYDVTITQENIFDVLQEEVELNYDKEKNTPKAIIADLVPKVLEILLNQTDKQKEIVSVLTNQLASKDIQIYLKASDIQEKVYQFGWSGALLDSKKDYLNVVTTNIGGGKTDNDIYQNIDHQAEIMPNGEIINTVRVTKINQGRKDNVLAGIDGGNVTYLRFYVPKGSEFISAQGFDQLSAGYFQQVEATTKIDPDVAKEEVKMIDGESQTEIYESLNKTVFANWLALAPGETQTVSIKYKLPFRVNIENSLVNNWWQKLLTGDVQLDSYSLLVQSQSGSKNTILNSSVLLPNNLRVVWNQASDNQQMSINEKIVTYSQKLLTDQYFGFILTAK